VALKIVLQEITQSDFQKMFKEFVQMPAEVSSCRANVFELFSAAGFGVWLLFQKCLKLPYRMSQAN
jgi:hypothetical protein